MKLVRRGITTKALLICLAILIGLIAGPLQAIYCIGFSGKLKSEHEIIVGESTDLQLSPDMNPIRFVATIDYDRPRNITGISEATRFDATLSANEVETWTQRFGVKLDDDNEEHSSGITISRGGTYPATLTTNIRSFAVDAPGDFSLVVTPTKANDLKVNEIVVAVKQNVRQVNVPVAVAGGIMLVLGVIVGFVSLILKKPVHALHSA